jgi:hypothetical protein
MKKGLHLSDEWLPIIFSKAAVYLGDILKKERSGPD